MIRSVDLTGDETALKNIYNFCFGGIKTPLCIDTNAVCCHGSLSSKKGLMTEPVGRFPRPIITLLDDGVWCFFPERGFCDQEQTANSPPLLIPFQNKRVASTTLDNGWE